MQIMRKPEVLAATGLCNTTIYNLEKKGKFPASRKLGCKSVGWIRQEVEAWIDNLQCKPVPEAAAI